MADNAAPDQDGVHPGQRIGTAERKSACAALDAHLAKGRIGRDEHQQRCAVGHEARTRGELLSVFADLPQPHPKLPGLPGPSDNDGTPFESAIAVISLLGLPATVVFGLVYHAWWTLAVPIVLTAALLFYGEHLRDRRRTVKLTMGPPPHADQLRTTPGMWRRASSASDGPGFQEETQSPSEDGGSTPAS